MSEPTTETIAKAARVLLVDANKELRTILAAHDLMEEWGVDTMLAALLEATTRVRGARRRQGYDHQD